MRLVDWQPIKVEMNTAFGRFENLLVGLGESDPRWKMVVSQTLRGVEISAHYFDTEEAARGGTDYHAVDVVASMNFGSTSGSVSMKGNEAWEFRLAEEVGQKVADVLTQKLEEAGLRPRQFAQPYRDRTQEGRKSYWFVIWNIYPANHPKVAGGK